MVFLFYSLFYFFFVVVFFFVVLVLDATFFTTFFLAADFFVLHPHPQAIFGSFLGKDSLVFRLKHKTL
jgi:hypothetical protein